MQILYKNLKKGELRFKAQDNDDLWFLSGIIEEGDSIKGRTLRKIKVGGTDEKSSAVRKPVFISIRVEKVEFARYSSILRVSGTVEDGPEDVPRGVHHTFAIEANSVFQIKKEHWPSYLLDKLDEATKKQSKILIVAFDREEAVFALLHKQGGEILSEVKGEVPKKDFEGTKVNFYAEIAKAMEEYVKRHGIERVVLASPAFFKEYVMKEIMDESVRKKIIPASCNAIGRSAISEILKRPEVVQAIKDERTIMEENLVESLFLEISKNACAAYGIKDTRNAVDSGAVKALLVTDKLIYKKRESGDYRELETLMRLAESMKAEVHIIDSENNAGKKLDGLGGIGAILRYKMNYE